jgi:hypothetical protein
MADLTVTAASVIAGANASTRTGSAGTTITAGQLIYIDAAGLVQPAKADTVIHSGLVGGNIIGIALNGGSVNQPIQYQVSGNINPGATVAVGTIYIVSPTNAGGIAPIGDAATGTFMSILGIGTSASNILLQPWVTGVNHA